LKNEPNDDRIREALPGYDVGGVIGQGGCGVVLSGMHRSLQRAVAIKRIPAQLANDSAVRRRFVAEARLMAAVDHPHVVPVYDYVEHGELCLLVMEYLPGGSVADRFARDGFDAGSAMAVALACAAGLEAAHRRGILHRDVKPANLMFGPHGTVKLSDFGIAKIVGGDETMVTKAGEVIGTPSYMAPEQARGQPLSPATDVYALATMLYQLLSGVLPFPPSDESMVTLFLHAFEQPTPLSKMAPNLPAPIADVVMKGLATDPADRFGSAESFGIALAQPAAQCWGSDWLAPVGIPVIGADTIVAAATGTGRHPDPSATVRIPTPPRPPGGGRRGQPLRIRQAQPLPRPQIQLANVAAKDLAPVQKVVDFRSPRVPFLVASALGLIAIALALVGLGAPPTGGELRPGTVTVAGVDPTSGVVEVDMSHPIPVTSVDGTSAELSLVVVGQSLARHQVPLTPGVPAAVAPPVSPYLLAGRLTAELVVHEGESSAASYRFPIRTTQSPLTTALAVGIVVLALFAVAYVESYIRTLRRGRSRVSGSFGLTLSAAALGVAAVGAVWVLMGREPTIATIIGCGIVAAAAGIAATVGSLRIGTKYRYRRAGRRASR
jgi:hypothetical protein